MPGFLRISLLVLFAVVSTGLIVQAQNCPGSDLNDDCVVDISDLAEFWIQWLDSPGGSANLDGQDGVKMGDFGVFAGDWLAGITLVINEFMADNEDFFRDAAGEDDDWIELYNFGDLDIDIAGMHLTDNLDNPKKWPVPKDTGADTIVPAGGYLLIWADNDAGQEGLHASFALARGGGEDVGLFDAEGKPIDAIDNFDAQMENHSFGRFPDGGGSWRIFGSSFGTAPTPGKANSMSPADDNIVMSEIMYHPYHDIVNYEPENTGEEYIELYNKGAATINLQDWQFTDGIDFVFPTVTLDAGGYLVVAADLAAFQARYPSVSNVVAGWTGRLRNSGERIVLINAEGRLIDETRYSDQGDWAQRELGALDHEHRGWMWSDDHDGDGSSLELINIDVSNEYGQNWAASIGSGGTPGATNSVAAEDIAPLILDVEHFPIIPGAGDPVTVTAKIIDELPTGVTVTLHHRLDGEPTFNMVTMSDDGASGDGVAGDGVYGGEIPAQADGKIVEFYVRAGDAAANSRTWPAASIVAGTPEQVTNALYQVDNSYNADTPWVPGSQPVYYIIMIESERAELEDIGNGGDPFFGEARSNAQMNGTFISVDGVDTKVRYSAGIRNRGNRSRAQPPNNFRVNFRHDRSWKGVTALTINSKYPHLQVLGSALFRWAGMAAPEATAVQLRVNGVNLAESDYGRTYNSYAAIEGYNSDWAENHFPDDDAGNLYRCTYVKLPGGGTTYGDLDYKETPGQTPDPDDYRDNYPKQTNRSQDDYSDLFNLIDKLNNTSIPDADLLEEVGQVANLDQWMRFMAIDAFAGNREGGLYEGEGDDYAMYRGVIDPRFWLLPHDLDTLFGQGDHSYRPDWEIFGYTDVAGLERLFDQDEIWKAYYGQFKELAETVFAPENVNPIVDQLLASWVPQSEIEGTKGIKQFVIERPKSILYGGYPGASDDPQIPQEFTIVAPAVQNGYAYTTSSTVSLSGKFNAAVSRSMRVNGQLVSDGNWSQKNGQWSMGGIQVNPGINRITVEAFDEADGNGSSVYNEFVDVWYDDGSTSDVLSLAGDTVLDAASGPWRIATSMTVPGGVTLTIEAGTTVYFGQGARLTVNGRLAADGREFNRIRLTVDPVSSATWGGLRFDGSDEDNRMVCVDMESSGSAGESVRLDYSRILIDNMTWSQTNETILQIENSSAIVRNSVFPDNIDDQSVSGHGLLTSNPYLIFDNNIFGVHIGEKQDVLDCTTRGSTYVPQFTNNVFLGGGDDALDLDDTYAFVAGNVFMNFHRNFDASRGESYAVTSGGDGYGGSNHLIVRNLFINCDHAALSKDDSWINFQNNTVVNCLVGINFREPHETSGVSPGLGGYLSGNIFYNTPDPVASYYLNDPDPTKIDSDVTVEYSIIPDGIPGAFLGSGNILNADPLFVDAGSDDYHLKSDSAAVGTGPNGIDMGMHVPVGASISGPNSLTTALTSITYTIAGPAITHYKWRLDGGSWSVTEQTVDTALVLSSLSQGGHILEVIGKNYAGVWQEQADATVRTWTVDSSQVALVINEVLAHSHDPAPDLIELYYDGPGTLDMAGMSITDNPGDPRKHVFGAGTTIDAGQYKVLVAEPTSTVPGHLDFALNSLGDEVYLYDAGGNLIDSVEFGMQWRYWSIGRLGDDKWHLTVPTSGSPNVKQPLGDPADLKINEWLANGRILFVDDFIELYNPGPHPVNLSDLYLTDNHITQPLKSRLGPLSFIEPNGYAVFIADDRDRSGHVDFKLSADHEILALYDADGNEIDKVIYYAQKTDVSQGRSPDGSDNLEFFTLPTPGVANPGNVGGETIEINLIDIEHVWSYDQSNTDLSTGWRDPDYVDSSWPTGAALLYVEGSALPAPKNTPLILGARTYYFRSHFTIGDELDLADIVELNVATVVDDAAVIYINGTEVLRVGFNDNTVVTHYTWSDRGAVSNADYEYFTIPAADLRPDDNVIAVEVHQRNATSSDIVFGLALDAVVSVSQGDDPLADARLLLDNLRITELMYNPPDGTEHEFIELHNTGAESLDLWGVRFTDGIDFTFPAPTELAAGASVVLAADRQAFALKYPSVPQGIVFGPYDGKLNNGGEKIVLKLPEPFEAAILRFEYDNSWYAQTDGGGRSLTIRDPQAAIATWDEPESWQPSTAPGGTPGQIP